MMGEFRSFLLTTNALALAVGVIIGTALGTVVNSLVNDIIMPPIGLVLGGVDFSTLKIVLKDAVGGDPATEVAIRYGLFLNGIIAFVVIAGLEEISEGDLKIGDRVVNNVAPKDRDIAMVFQSYALYPHMSIYDNMAFGLKLRKVPKADIDRRVKDATRILNLENLQKKP